MTHQEAALTAYIGLLRTANQLAQMAKADVRCYGLNITEFSVMELLYHRGTQATQAIKEKILIASSTTTYVIDQLEKKGHVQRQHSPHDQRISLVSLTESGKTLMDAIFPYHAQQIEQLFDAISTEELTTLKSTLRKIKQP